MSRFSKPPSYWQAKFENLNFTHVTMRTLIPSNHDESHVRLAKSKEIVIGRFLSVKYIRFAVWIFTIRVCRCELRLVLFSSQGLHEETVIPAVIRFFTSLFENIAAKKQIHGK